MKVTRLRAETPLQVHLGLTPPRISAVSFLNTAPLVWGLLHGPQAGLADLSFELPSACADSVAAGTAACGIVPVIEVERHALPYIPTLGIASSGPVRSIFLISKVPAQEIRSVAMDTSSRTSVRLAQIVLSRKYSVFPSAIPHPPDLDAMLRIADAALLIGDPALLIDPVRSPYRVYDLGAEWTGMTGLPIVYAVWAGQGALGLTDLLHDSYRFGRDRIEEIVQREAAPRGIDPALARTYLTRHIVFELAEEHRRGMALYLLYAREYAR